MHGVATTIGKVTRVAATTRPGINGYSGSTDPEHDELSVLVVAGMTPYTVRILAPVGYLPDIKPGFVDLPVTYGKIERSKWDCRCDLRKVNA